jgi:hypothetical protein
MQKRPKHDPGSNSTRKIKRTVKCSEKIIFFSCLQRDFFNGGSKFSLELCPDIGVFSAYLACSVEHQHAHPKKLQRMILIIISEWGNLVLTGQRL